MDSTAAWQKKSSLSASLLQPYIRTLQKNMYTKRKTKAIYGCSIIYVCISKCDGHSTKEKNKKKNYTFQPGEEAQTLKGHNNPNIYY